VKFEWDDIADRLNADAAASCSGFRMPVPIVGRMPSMPSKSGSLGTALPWAAIADELDREEKMKNPKFRVAGENR
jgi:hypothetical protein